LRAGTKSGSLILVRWTILSLRKINNRFLLSPGPSRASFFIPARGDAGLTTEAMKPAPLLSVQAKEDQDHTGRYTGYTKLEMIYKHQEEQEVTNDPLPPPPASSAAWSRKCFNFHFKQAIKYTLYLGSPLFNVT